MDFEIIQTTEEISVVIDDQPAEIISEGIFEIIQTTEEISVVIDDQPAEIISEGMMGPPGAKGDKGDQGLPGSNQIGGLAVQLTSPADGDILAIQADKVINISAPSLTDGVVDGGNF